MWPGPCHFVKGPVESGDWGGYRVCLSTGVAHNGHFDPWDETRYMARLPPTRTPFIRIQKKMSIILRMMISAMKKDAGEITLVKPQRSLFRGSVLSLIGVSA